MPEITDAATAPWGRYGHAKRWLGAMLVVAMPLSLLACSPLEEPAAPAVADASPPTSDELPSAPIALAPSITGRPAPAPRPTLVSAVATTAPAPAAPVEAVALAAPPPQATAAAIETALATPPAASESAAAAPSPCPTGATAVMSKPDMAGIPVLLCRRR